MRTRYKHGSVKGSVLLRVTLTAPRRLRGFGPLPRDWAQCYRKPNYWAAFVHGSQLYLAGPHGTPSERGPSRWSGLVAAGAWAYG